MYSRDISIAVPILLYLLVAIPTIAGTQIWGRATVEDNTLDKYVGREFKVYILGRLGSSDSIDYLDRAGEILYILRSREPSINSLDDIVAEDIYLSPLLGDKLVPVLKLRYRNIITVVALDTDTSTLLSIGVFTGEPHNGGLHGTVIDWENILSSATKPSALEKSNVHVGIGDIVIALSFILVPIAIVTIIAYTVVKAED